MGMLSDVAMQNEMGLWRVPTADFNNPDFAPVAIVYIKYMLFYVKHETVDVCPFLSYVATLITGYQTDECPACPTLSSL